MHEDSSYHYNTLESGATAEYKEKGSRFIAFAFPVTKKDEAKSQLAEVKKQHPKATHHCFAYRIGINEVETRVSDSGEPAGSAGKPILGQIESRKLTNVLIIVVRYFGGTLLGIPGLINAYRTSAAIVLQMTPIIRKEVQTIFNLQFDYTLLNDVITIVRQYQCTIIHQETQLFCTLKVAVPLRHETEVLQRWKDKRIEDVVRLS